MKKSVILDIFNGDRGQRESFKLPENIINKKADVICDTYDELEKKLSPELLLLHQKFVDALESTWSDELDFYYAEGFKLGLLTGIECME